jgi:hypothetical protein
MLCVTLSQLTTREGRLNASASGPHRQARPCHPRIKQHVIGDIEPDIPLPRESRRPPPASRSSMSAIGLGWRFACASGERAAHKLVSHCGTPDPFRSISTLDQD